MTTRYVCLRAGEKPPEQDRTTTRREDPVASPPPLPTRPNRAKDPECREIAGTDGSKTIVCGNR